MVWFVPVTPAGTPVPYGGAARMGKMNASKTRDGAIQNLLEDAAHMPYVTWENFEKRGYTIEEWPDESLGEDTLKIPKFLRKFDD